MPGKEPNIILVVIDALRTRNLGAYGFAKSFTPNIDDLATQGILFEQAYSCNVVTDSSLTTIFSGKYPTSHGILSHGERVTKEEITKLSKSNARFLSEILKSKGYTTLAIDWLGRWHKRGFDYYSGSIRRAKPVRFPIKIVDSVLSGVLREYANFKKSTSIDEAHIVTDAAINLITQLAEQKFFLFVHYWDTHTPYAPPKFFYRKVGASVGGMLKRVINPTVLKESLMREENVLRYLASIAYVDHEVGRLLQTLETRKIADQTLVILTADHGESLTEHQIYFLHHGLYDPTIHVPLIMRYPHRFANNLKVTGLVQHFDILPTILDIINVKYMDHDGKSLIPLITGEVDELHSAIYAEEAYYQRRRAIRTINYKYINLLSEKEIFCKHCSRVHGDAEELYDLNGDPDETDNIINERPRTANMLRKKLSDWINSLEKP